MDDPLARYPDTVFTSARLAPETAALAAGCDVASIFVNDDAAAASVRALAAVGVTHVSLRCAGYDNVDLVAAAGAGVTVTRVPTYAPCSVAEHALALTLTLTRSVHRAVNRMRESNFELSGLVGRQLRDKTVGIVGTGAIGVEAAHVFHGVGCRVVAYDPTPNPAARPYASFVPSLTSLLAQSDIVSLHVPLLPSTHHIINRESLAAMKRGAVLVNVSRGGLVNTAAALDALQTGQLGGLALDVYEREASIFFEDLGEVDFADRLHTFDRELALLQSFPTAVVTPHCAFLTQEALAEIAATVVKNIDDVAAGRACANEVVAKQ